VFSTAHAFFKKYLQCVLAAKILIVYFVVYTLAVKKNQGRFRHVGSDHSFVSPTPQNEARKIISWTVLYRLKALPLTRTAATERYAKRTNSGTM
jgi:hypothetical protein